MDPTKQIRRLYYKGLLGGGAADPVDVDSEDEVLLALVASRKSAEHGFEFLRGSDFTGSDRPARFRRLRKSWRTHRIDVPEGMVPEAFRMLCESLRHQNVRRTVRTLSWRFVGVAYFGAVDEWMGVVRRSVELLEKRTKKEIGDED